MNWNEIIIAVITALVPVTTTIVTSRAHNKTFERNAAKHTILQMIMEDRLNIHEGKPVMNYQAVLHEFDIYTAQGGNSYIKDKVEEYKKWLMADKTTPANN